jgi:hypothetical protein
LQVRGDEHCQGFDMVTRMFSDGHAYS